MALPHSPVPPKTRIRTIARRRYFRPDQNWNRGPRINELIRKSPVRLIDENGDMVGVVETPDALQRARDAGLDLVEIAADSDPVVCRILDFGKFKYEQAKKDKANKARSKTAEMKEIRLGRSMKIDPHDIAIRLSQARRFLMEGHKVQIVQNFRGREMVHRHRGTQRMQEIIDKLADVAKVEMPPRQAGRRMTMMLAPDKPKIEQIKRREAARRQTQGGKTPPPPREDELPDGELNEETGPQIEQPQMDAGDLAASRETATPAK